MITIKTDNPIAYDSPDHIYPTGTKNDNNTNLGFIEEVEELFKLNFNKDKIKFMDLGCSGGQLAVDFHERGHISVGLEGSDYSVKHERANWPKYHNKVLFTCDIIKPYELFEDGKKLEFDCISIWEVIEHIQPKDLEALFVNINNNLAYGGICVGSIAQFAYFTEEGINLHQSAFSEVTWYQMFKVLLEKTDLVVYQYPFQNKVREDKGSFYILLRKEPKS